MIFMCRVEQGQWFYEYCYSSFPTGKSSAEGAISCTDGTRASCPAGAFPSNGACAECSKGTFNPLEGASACMLCEPGKHGSGLGATACMACELGE